mgnify:CR=1 FL=1
MVKPVPITTECYRDRIAQLTRQLQLLHHQLRQDHISEELEDLLQQQMRTVSASLWSLHAEVEQD